MTNKIEFTEQAIKQIEKQITNLGKKTYFRITVQGGGCSGFKYNFSFDEKINQDDVVVKNAVIDNDSLKLINGSIVDYKDELIGSSFVIKNPKATASCGCGLSFSI
ncbi:MAG: HesB/IscA family protein [Pelagibacteraceae bacterium]|jgi:iron-sulfur cluster insertion protein